MAIYTRNMKQDATYYPPLGQDGFGDLSWGPGVAIKCRWQDKAELFRDTQAREVVSSAIVYPSYDCKVGGKIGLGAATVDEAVEIRQRGSSPSLRADQELIKLWL